MEKVTVGVSLLFCACGGVQGLTSEDVFGLSPNPKVWLSGLCTNARTGAPLPSVAVQVEGASTTSDRYGAFRLEGLPMLETDGSASAEGFQVHRFALALRAGANVRDLALEPLECGVSTCGPDELCSANGSGCVKSATITGAVVSACDGEALDSRVTVDGKSVCSSALSGKAYFQLRHLTPGGPQTLSAGKEGYQAFSTSLTLQPGFNEAGMIRLTPIGGCAAGKPANVACTCTQPSCQ